MMEVFEKWGKTRLSSGELWRKFKKIPEWKWNWNLCDNWDKFDWKRNGNLQKMKVRCKRK